MAEHEFLLALQQSLAVVFASGNTWNERDDLCRSFLVTIYWYPGENELEKVELDPGGSALSAQR